MMRLAQPAPRAASDSSHELGERNRASATQLAGAVARGLGYAIAIGLAILIVTAGVLPRVLGAVPLAVLSGSMVPTFSPGDLVISQPVDPATVKTGDVITFQPTSGDPTLITHRIIGFEFGNDGTRNIVTQGDANSDVDPVIVPDQVMGKMLYSIPYMGYVSNGVSALNLAWLLPAVGVVLIGVAVAHLLAAFRRRVDR